MNIVLDLDGVLADFAGGFEKMFGGHVQLPEFNVSKEQWKAIDATKGSFWCNLPLLTGGKYLASLGEVPENLFILTSRNSKKTTGDTYTWFERHGIVIPEPNIIFANPRAKKVEWLQNLSPCRFLDDSISNVDFCGTIRGVETTLMLQSYNGACALKYFPLMDVTNSVERWLNGDYHVKRQSVSELSTQSR